MRIIMTAAAIAATGLIGAALARPADAAAPAAAAATLPQGPGHDTMVRVCSGCHAPEIVVQQRLDAAGWKDVVELMAANGAVASDAELEEITAYLTKAFPATAAP